MMLVDRRVVARSSASIEERRHAVAPSTLGYREAEGVEVRPAEERDRAGMNVLGSTSSSPWAVVAELYSGSAS
ncbi:hypothetical protein CCMA1212_009001 [Trichoderma ghanense]|uniref:Uncharacterized protein n=1 Tax=Trichoderma ghanense TaxID=65468 RepID=A0ABY2GT93_9HYPO